MYTNYNQYQIKKLNCKTTNDIKILNNKTTSLKCL